MDQQNNQQPQQGQQQVQVKIEDSVLRGAYANMMQVAHTQEEFVLDFMNIMGAAGIVSSRVIVSPAHMKRIVAALQDNLKRYEEQHGTIEAGQNPANNFGFRTE
jgi:dihydrodipicolinate synthase/N-acetylneuraminate lyase